MSFLPFIVAGFFCGFIDSCLGMGFSVYARANDLR